jgi:IS30 family transposase
VLSHTGQDQQTRYRDSGQRADQARQALAKGALPIADLDRGSEMASHRLFTLATDIQVYFCDTRSAVDE